MHSEKILKYYSCIGGCLVAQHIVAEIWSMRGHFTVICHII